MRTRWIGSITLGITLIATGLVYLIEVFYPAFNVMGVLRFWPVILISLGIEVLAFSKKN